MAYLQSYRSDYLGSYRGDPGLFGFIKKAVGKVAGFGTSLIPGPIGAGIKIARGFGQKGPGGVALPVMPSIGGGFMGQKSHAVGPRKRRRMNYTNPKALRRSVRRVDGFVKVARKALQGTGYQVSRRGSSARRAPVTVRESGPGSVTVRR